MVVSNVLQNPTQRRHLPVTIRTKASKVVIYVLKNSYDLAAGAHVLVKCLRGLVRAAVPAPNAHVKMRGLEISYGALCHAAA